MPTYNSYISTTLNKGSDMTFKWNRLYANHMLFKQRKAQTPELTVVRQKKCNILYDNRFEGISRRFETFFGRLRTSRPIQKLSRSSAIESLKDMIPARFMPIFIRSQYSLTRLPPILWITCERRWSGADSQPKLSEHQVAINAEVLPEKRFGIVADKNRLKEAES